LPGIKAFLDDMAWHGKTKTCSDLWTGLFWGLAISGRKTEGLSKQMEKQGRLTSKQRKMLTAAMVLVLAVTSFQVYWVVTGAHVPPQVPQANASTQQRYNSTITVSGTGQAKVQPDRAILEIGVTTQNSTAEAAASRNAYLMNGVIASLEAIGISNSSMSTVSYSITPVYSCCGGTQTVTGYTVSDQLEVTVIATGGSLMQLGDRVGQAIDAAVSHGANVLYGIQFTASDQATAQARVQAHQMAVKDASSQATSIAAALGVNITGVVSATTANVYYPAPVMFAASIASAGTPVIPPQSLTVSATVTVTYSIS